MIKKVLLLLIFTTASLFAMNFQTASKNELMSIKGIGEKRAASIIKYRKTNKIKSADDLKNIPGIGKEVVNNAKKGIKNSTKKVVKKSTKKTVTKPISKKAPSKKEVATKKPKIKKELKKAGDKTKKAQKKSLAKIKKETKKIEKK